MREDVASKDVLGGDVPLAVSLLIHVLHLLGPGLPLLELAPQFELMTASESTEVFHASDLATEAFYRVQARSHLLN